MSAQHSDQDDECLKMLKAHIMVLEAKSNTSDPRLAFHKALLQDIINGEDREKAFIKTILKLTDLLQQQHAL